MTILSNNLQLDHIFNNFYTEFINNSNLLISPDSIYNFTNCIEEIDNSLKVLASNLLKKKFETLDDAYFKSAERKRYYRVKAKRSRTLITIFGQITYTRRIYESFHDGSFYIYVDRKMGLPKYDRYDPTVKAKLCETYINIGSMIKTGQIVGEQMFALFSTKKERKNYNISRQTVYNVLKNMHKLQPKIDRISNTPETLYIMADEKYVAIQSGTKNKVMVKHAVLFEGFSSHHKRNTLVNKLHFTSLDKNFWEQFHDFIARVYDLTKVKNIVLMGDGAPWIKAGANEIPKVQFYLDKFHTFQAINQMSKDPIIRYNLRQTLLENNRKLFKEITEVLLIQNQDNISREENIKDKRRYILRHWRSIQRTLDSNQRCAMESHISHNLASIFTSRPKAYEIKNLERYVSLRDLHLNDVDILKAYLKTIHYEKTNKYQDIEKEIFDFSIFEPRTNYDKSSTSNWVKGFISRN